MRDINLLPRKTFLEKYVLIVVVGVFAIGALLLLLQYNYFSGYTLEREQAEQQLRETELQIAQAAQKLRPDPNIVQYENVRREIDRLKEQRTDWLTDLTYVLGYLPETTQIYTMSVGGSGLLSMDLEFSNIDLLLSYLTELQAEPRYKFGLTINELYATPIIEGDGQPAASAETDGEEQKVVVEDELTEKLESDAAGHGEELQSRLQDEQSLEAPLQEELPQEDPQPTGQPSEAAPSAGADDLAAQILEDSGFSADSQPQLNIVWHLRLKLNIQLPVRAEGAVSP